MKIIALIMGVLAALLLLSTAICGLWIKANQVTEASSLQFHMTLGLIAVVVSLVSFVLLFMRLR